MTNLMQILDQIKNQFPVPVFSWGHFIPSIVIVSSAPLIGVLHRRPFSPETLADVFSQKIIDCCVMAWLIMHKITFDASWLDWLCAKSFIHASLRAVADGAAIYTLLVTQPRCFASLWIASRPLRARSQ